MEKYKGFPLEVKKEVRKRQKSRCADCGEKVKRLEIHHIIPVALLGINRIINAVGLCGSKNNNCHAYWDKKTFEEGIIYPGISITKAPINLFTYGKRRRDLHSLPNSQISATK